MERRPNTASQQTKQALAAALKELMAQKPIENITIHDLTEHCGIRRQTFYYHFQDIMEVIEWSMERATQKMLARSLETESPEYAIGVLISAAMENRTLIRRLLASQKREQIEKVFVQAVRTYLQNLIRNKANGLALYYSDMELALDFWAFGISGLLFKYCEQEQVDVKSMAQQICRLLPEKIDSKEDVSYSNAN